MAVTVYSKPACVYCNSTFRTLERDQIPYTTVDVTKDPEALKKIQDMGFRSAPVVVTDSDAWSGFRPDKLMELKQRLRKEEVQSHVQ